MFIKKMAEQALLENHPSFVSRGGIIKLIDGRFFVAYTMDYHGLECRAEKSFPIYQRVHNYSSTELVVSGLVMALEGDLERALKKRG